METRLSHFHQNSEFDICPDLSVSHRGTYIASHFCCDFYIFAADMAPTALYVYALSTVAFLRREKATAIRMQTSGIT
ncbi:hypothetical protein CASFOL_021088 [Castilleja foliolosa]|uniref:Uncharacterized protein n=1 Tax=Castilleja foliolosa TaxID=1961234 RepID=A0ABD3CWS0_9LAMI